MKQAECERLRRDAKAKDELIVQIEEQNKVDRLRLKTAYVRLEEDHRAASARLQLSFEDIRSHCSNVFADLVFTRTLVDSLED